EPDPVASSTIPWLWGGLGLLALALLVWVLTRRRPAPAVAKPRRSFDSEALAASMRRPAIAASAPKVEAAPKPELAESGTQRSAAGPPTVGDVEVKPLMDVEELPTPSKVHGEEPTWHSGRWVKADAQPDTGMPTASSPRFVSIADDSSAHSVSDGFQEPLPEPASAEQRMKLARAFLDIGDNHSAKQLLVELKDAAADSTIRTEAANLLREIR
ncbi:MAG: hypothetical protein M3Q51_03090, partial [Pseudomonadota bacterium]|nr:hypothetical protein [Pseudomonadota bacterium]